MTKEELFDKIQNWEIDHSESFNDYFSHDNIRDSSWAFWLLGKGFNNHAHIIMDEILADNKCIDQEVLYHVFSTKDENGQFIADRKSVV